MCNIQDAIQYLKQVDVQEHDAEMIDYALDVCYAEQQIFNSWITDPIIIGSIDF